MVFEIKNKVVLLTGGAMGIGLATAKELLESGVKGLTIADINENGEKVVEDLQNKFGQDRVIFVKTDVADSESFENAFKKTVETFKNVDVLINNAGIHDDEKWQLEIDVNFKGTVNGIILGLENYLKNFKQGEEAVILNTSSINGVNGFGYTPIYGGTKFAITGVTLCWGCSFHYKRSNVRVIAICPGIVQTNMIENTGLLRPDYVGIIDEKDLSIQSPEFVARETKRILEKAPNGSLWVVENEEPAYQYIFENRIKFRKNVLK